MTTSIATTRAGGTGLIQAPLLTPTTFRPPVCGKIRSGHKVMTKAAAANQECTKIYKAGVAEQRRFDDINRDCQKILFAGKPEQAWKNVLYPKNLPYFLARRCDFSVPEMADALFDMYAEDGEYGRQIYRFPAVFPTDDIEQAIPHSLRAYTRNELAYWSEPSPNGERMCMLRQPPEIDPKSKRARRYFGGRPIVTRGKCDPNQCAEYQNRQCTLSGSFMFFVPGIPGAGLVELPTTSYYALAGVVGVLSMVASLRGGQFSGTHVDGRPLFWFTKQHKAVSRITDEGKVEKTTHPIITLVADVTLAQSIDYAPAALEAAPLAIEGPQSEYEEEPDTQSEPQRQLTNEPAAPTPQEAEAIKALRAEALAAMKKAELDPKRCDAFFQSRFGDDWAKRMDGLDSAIQLLAEPESLKADMEVPF